MTGNGGWGYTLTRADVTERIETTPVSNASSESYTIQPVATGATVFGVFEGRTPCQGIAREILWPVDASCRKLKWRVTLFKDSATQAPTTYRLEGSLFRSTPSEGRWTLAELGPASKRVRVLRLAASGAGSTLSLFQADDNVVFFLDRQDRLLAGTADFGYTLERRR
jgi:hypothetical protein